MTISLRIVGIFYTQDIDMPAGQHGVGPLEIRHDDPCARYHFQR